VTPNLRLLSPASFTEVVTKWFLFVREVVEDDVVVVFVVGHLLHDLGVEEVLEHAFAVLGVFESLVGLLLLLAFTGDRLLDHLAKVDQHFVLLEPGA
jgi:hypothetical protein